MGLEPIPDSGLINNQGVYNCSAPVVGLLCNPAQRNVIAVATGNRYRIRIINTSAYAAFNISIDGHKMTVIEADGILVNPYVVDLLHCNVAQRVSQFQIRLGASSDMHPWRM
jgi:iron transport multicopper oxidase